MPVLSDLSFDGKPCNFLAQFPAVGIQSIDGGQFDCIAVFTDAQAPIQKMYTKKAHIPITVRGSEAPSAVARLTGAKDANIVIGLNAGKAGVNF
jgi:hypothetical protein